MTDENKALADALKSLANKHNETARRLLLPISHSDYLNVGLQPADIALCQEVLQFIKANYGKIGDISLSYCVVRLVEKYNNNV